MATSNKGLVRKTKCPHCSYIIDDATAVSGENVVPKVGDISMCIMCGEVSLYDEDLGLRLPHSLAEEQSIYEHNPILHVAKVSIKKLQREANNA